MVKNIVDNGKEYRHIKTFRHEKDANHFTDDLEEKTRSKRFKPIIEKFSNGFWTKFRVYVPVGWKA